MEQYFKFDGTATRSEYWGTNIVGGICAAILILFGAMLTTISTSNLALAFGIIVIFVAFVGALWLSFATAVRRCRDANLNPWWALAVVIPYIGTITFIVLGCLKTDATAK